MYFSNCKKIILLLTIINIFHTSIYTTHTNLIYTTHTKSTLANNHPDTVEGFLEQAYTLPLKIDSMVERFMLMISKSQIRLLKNTGMALDTLKEIRMSLNIILKDQAAITATHDTNLQAQIIFSLIEICLVLCYHLDHAIGTNFNEIKPLRINKDSTYLRISLRLPTLDPVGINYFIKYAQNYIKELDKETGFVELTWYNKIAKKFENLAVKPCQKYIIKALNVFISIKTLQLNDFTSSAAFTYTWPWLDDIKTNHLRLCGPYKKTLTDILWTIKPTVHFKDVVGFDKAKEKLSSTIRFIEDPKKYLLTNTAPKQGFLLVGPTHIGKNFIVEAFCGEIANILKKQKRACLPKFWRVSSKMIGRDGITNIIETISNNHWQSGPVVLFIDDIGDLFLHCRRADTNKLLSQLLTSMTTPLDSDPNKQVILIATTNKPQLLYDVMKQNNCLGKEIRF